MAGMQSCCRSVLVLNISRLVNRNAMLFQPNQRKCHFFFQAYSSQNKLVLKKSAFRSYTGRLLTYRLMSTGVTQQKSTDSVISNQEIPSTKNESIQLKNDVDVKKTSEVVIDESTLPPAPESCLTELPDVEFISMGLKEPSFQSLGIGSWYPSGIVQQILEYFHINLGLPWWEAIILGTFICRLFLFPVYVKARKNQINLLNNLPELTKIQAKLNQAHLSGDHYSAALASREMQDFMKSKKVNFFSMFQTAFFQAPFFLSIFYGLKTMANLPVESLKAEGLFWFKDLTIPDPYYILPLVLSSTLLAIIEVGAEGGTLHKKGQIVKWGMRAIPLVIFCVSINFPSCITLYWTTSNFVVLTQVALFKIPAVSKVLKMPESKKFDPSELSASKKGFLEEFKEGYSNAKLTGLLKEREQMSLLAFQKAGTGPVPRTFKNNPVLQKGK